MTVTITQDDGTALRDSMFLRQQGFFDPNKHRNAEATFVGVGGIGSFAAFATAKLGVPKINLIDPDICELHNVPNQLHASAELGEYKVHALARMVMEHMGREVDTVPFPGYLADWPRYSGVVVGGLDSMRARMELWEKVRFNPSVQLFIDGRIAGQLIQLYTLCPFRPDHVKAYEDTLFDDSEAIEASCTERGLIDVGFQVGGLITRQIRKYYEGDDLNNVILLNQKTLSVMQGEFPKEG